MNWYLACLKNYVTFSGRARRMEYWMFVLFNILISIGLAVFDNIAGLTTSTGQGALSSVYGLMVLLPSLAVAVRRLHDIDKSGLWLLIGFIPCIGGLILLLLFVREGTPGENRFGPNPI